MSEQTPTAQPEELIEDSQQPQEVSVLSTEQPYAEGEDGRLSKDVAVEVAYAGKPERDRVFEMQKTKELAERFHAQSLERQNMLHKKQKNDLQEKGYTRIGRDVYDDKGVLSPFSEAAHKFVWHQREEEAELGKELIEEATDLVISNASAISELLKDTRYEDYGEYLNRLSNPVKRADQTDDEFEKELSQARDKVRGSAKYILWEIGGATGAHLMERHISNADAKEFQTQILAQNPEVVDDLKKLVEDINGQPLEAEVDLLPILNSALLNMSALSYELRRQSTLIGIDTTSFNEPDLVNFLDSIIKRNFGANSGVYSGWQELQQSDGTTVDQMKDYYDESFKESVSKIWDTLEVYDKGLAGYFRAEQKLRNQN